MENRNNAEINNITTLPTPHGKRGPLSEIEEVLQKHHRIDENIEDMEMNEFTGLETFSCMIDLGSEEFIPQNAFDVLPSEIMKKIILCFWADHKTLNAFRSSEKRMQTLIRDMSPNLFDALPCEIMEQIILCFWTDHKTRYAFGLSEKRMRLFMQNASYRIIVSKLEQCKTKAIKKFMKAKKNSMETKKVECVITQSELARVVCEVMRDKPIIPLFEKISGPHSVLNIKNSPLDQEKLENKLLESAREKMKTTGIMNLEYGETSNLDFFYGFELYSNDVVDIKRDILMEYDIYSSSTDEYADLFSECYKENTDDDEDNDKNDEEEEEEKCNPLDENCDRGCIAFHNLNRKFSYIKEHMERKGASLRVRGNYAGKMASFPYDAVCDWLSEVYKNINVYESARIPEKKTKSFFDFSNKYIQCTEEENTKILFMFLSDITSRFIRETNKRCELTGYANTVYYKIEYEIFGISGEQEEEVNHGFVEPYDLFSYPECEEIFDAYNQGVSSKKVKDLLKITTEVEKGYLNMEYDRAGISESLYNFVENPNEYLVDVESEKSKKLIIRGGYSELEFQTPKDFGLEVYGKYSIKLENYTITFDAYHSLGCFAIYSYNTNSNENSIAIKGLEFLRKLFEKNGIDVHIHIKIYPYQSKLPNVFWSELKNLGWVELLY